MRAGNLLLQSSFFSNAGIIHRKGDLNQWFPQTCPHTNQRLFNKPACFTGFTPKHCFMMVMIIETFSTN